MASPSIFSSSFQEQKIVLQTMDKAAGGIRGGENLSRDIIHTQDRIRDVSDQIAKLSGVVSGAFTRTKATMKSALGESQTVDFNSLPVRANLHDNFFGSEKKAYRETLTKIAQIAAQIPSLDLTYFSADYSATVTQAKISEFVNDVDVFDEDNEAASFSKITESIKDFSLVLMNATKAIVTIAAKGEVVKTLQARTAEIPTFERDRIILTSMIHLRNTHFNDVVQLKALISILAKEEDDTLFHEVFGNLFARATAEEFMTLFKHFHTFISSDDFDPKEISFINTFLYYLDSNMSPYVDAEDFVLPGQRKQLIQAYFMELATKFENNPAILNWNVSFIVNNPDFFTSELGGASRAPAIFTEMINTAIDGAEVKFEGMTRADFRRLLREKAADAPARISSVITREIYEIAAFKEVYDKLAETQSSLRAAQDLVFARATSPEPGYHTASSQGTGTPDRISLEEQQASRRGSVASLEEDGASSEEEWTEGEEEESPAPQEHVAAVRVKPPIAPKPGSRVGSTASTSAGGDLRGDLEAVLSMRKQRLGSESSDT